MKILQLAPLYNILSPNMDYGSIERILLNLDMIFIELGNESIVVARSNSIVKGHFIPVPVDTNSKDDYEYQAEIVTNYLQDNYVDIIHIHRRDFLISHAFINSFGGLKIPILTTFHGPADKICHLYKRLRNIENLYFNAVSHSQANGLKTFNISGVIYNGVDTQINNFQMEKGDYLFSFGRITRDKGPAKVIELAKDLKIKLIIGGVILNKRDEEYYSREIKPFIDESTIKFVGPLTDKKKIYYYQNARAVVMPITWDDPCPLVAIEAMACGTPVVAYNRGALPELVKDGETGFIVEDYQSMKEAISNIQFINPTKCRERVLKHFSADIMAKKYLELYQQIIQ